jgi:hypothetical protein
MEPYGGQSLGEFGMVWDRNKHLDPQRIEMKRKSEKRLSELLESGDEEGYVALVKSHQPNITPELLVSLIERFRERRRQRSLR